MAKFISEPNPTLILRTLVALLAEQEGVDIEYEITEDGKVTYQGSTNEDVWTA